MAHGKKLAAIQFKCSPAFKAAWDHFAGAKGKEPGVLAREIAEDFLACFLTDAELIKLGMVAHLGRRGGGWVEFARREADKVSSAQNKRGA